MELESDRRKFDAGLVRHASSEKMAATRLVLRSTSWAGPGFWGSLLAACMTHKNTRLAGLASEKIFELDPGNAGYQVLLSNIYSTENNFPKAASVRSVTLGKTPGVTLIEIGEMTHLFTVGDRSHPREREIYEKLDKLTGKMRPQVSRQD